MKTLLTVLLTIVSIKSFASSEPIAVAGTLLITSDIPAQEIILNDICGITAEDVSGYEVQKISLDKGTILTVEGYASDRVKKKNAESFNYSISSGLMLQSKINDKDVRISIYCVDTAMIPAFSDVPSLKEVLKLASPYIRFDLN